jgi:Fe-S-cluster-containing dehydrogenase component
MIADREMSEIIAEKVLPEKAAGPESALAKNAETDSKNKALPKPAGKPKKRRRIKVAHPERCIGCLSCMFACSRTHTGRASLQDSAIKILTRGGIEGDFVVVVCRGCENPPCARACPTGALERRPDGSVVFHKDLCTGCGKCKDACLIGAITLGKEGKPIKCMHCGACVAFCPHGVLELEEVPA